MSSRVALPALENDQTRATEDGDEERLAELNGSLTVLATIFPRIAPEVFREMLRTFDGESRLHVVAEQLLKHQDEWVKGRWRKAVKAADNSKHGQLPVTAEDRFRRASYKWAVRTVLYEEFKVLSRSKIEGALAEENFCYTRARLTLQYVASKSWRNSFSVFWSKWLKSFKSSHKHHYMMIWLKNQGDEAYSVPILRETGDEELDMELYQSVLLPFLQKTKKEQEEKDWEIAMILNEAEAVNAQAMYECQCCFSDTTFEQMATCTTGAHVICFRCIKNAVSEALFGQSWGRNIEHTRGQLKCLAPMSDESCDGCISHISTRRAILPSKGGKEALIKLETRLAEESLMKSRLALVHCPFCAYAEIDDLYFAPSTVRYRLNTTHSKANVFLVLLLLLNLVPLLFLYELVTRLSLFRKLPTITSMFSTSLAHLSRSRHLSRRFQCRSPLCGLPSCLTCSKLWHDPHVCHESAVLSLRTTIEAARTRALKRTCPHCGLGFIKDSGCNKLTCVCGYAMCYICRQGLGRGHGAEGYRHFCQHFRPAGGVCKECDKCDLYINEDDENLVKRAGALAEREWREKEGMTGVMGIGGVQEDATRVTWLVADWTMQDLMDWWVNNVIDC